MKTILTLDMKELICSTIERNFVLKCIRDRKVSSMTNTKCLRFSFVFSAFGLSND